ncbi:MAG: hypothetical protein HQM09_09055 [Candidatus Riflebacteria bacterium]|nr:hypothetical protein [Candidatus Riflebacteria bacterium]
MKSSFLQTLAILFAVMAGIPTLLYVGISIERRGQENLDRCSNNLRSIKYAMEMFSMDNDGYPAKLSLLAPDYLKRKEDLICPAAGVDTYSGGYTFNHGVPTPPGENVVRLASGSQPEYSIVCKGHNHRVFDYWFWFIPVFKDLVDEPSLDSKLGVTCSKKYHGFTD